MALQWPDKAPSENLDYRLNWRARIPAGDSITSSSWTSPAGITKGASTYTTYTTTLWLTGGTVGTTYEFTNTVVTTQGRTLQQTVNIKIVNK